MTTPFRKAKITSSAVDRLKSGETVADSELDGFFVRRQKEARVYFVRKFARGQRHFVTIGKHGAEYTPSKARDEALVIVAALRQGRDPARERAKLKQMPTVAEYAEEFLRHNLPGVKPGTLTNYAGIYRNHIKPRLGKWKLDAVTSADITTIHRQLRSTPRAANHVVDFMGSLYKQARRGKLVPTDFNPCAEVDRFNIENRERYLSKEELLRLFAVLRDAEAKRLAGPYAIAAIGLLLLTGSRRNEVLTLKWDHVDLERGLLRLPDSKTGAKSVYLNRPAANILQAVPRIAGNPYVIVGERAGRHLVNLQKPWRRIRRAAGLDDVRIHDLRHTFASIAAGRGASLPIIGKLLGHSDSQTTQRYSHLADDPVRQISDQVGERLGEIMTIARADADPVVASSDERKRAV